MWVLVIYGIYCDIWNAVYNWNRLRLIIGFKQRCYVAQRKKIFKDYVNEWRLGLESTMEAKKKFKEKKHKAERNREEKMSETQYWVLEPVELRP